MNSRVIRIDVLGGVGVGESSALVETVDRTGTRCFIMVDCGTGFSKDNNSPVPLPLRPRMRPDIILITHEHTDHSILAPRYFADYKCPIWMTGPAYYILDFLLEDHIKVAHNRKVKPLFSESELRNFHLSESVEAIYHSDWIEVFPGVEIKFYPNGHIRGSASILLKTDEKKIMFSGDISKNDTPTVKGITPPSDFQPDVLFLESTNGISPLPDREREVERLIETAKRFRRVLIPAFGVGRSPDVAVDLALRNFPVYLDGMGKKILIGCAQDEKFFWCENDQPVSREILRRIKFVKGQGMRGTVARDPYPKAVVTTGGMMNGPALSYAERWLEDPNSAVLDVGYVADGTPGFRLLKSVETGMPFELESGRTVKVSAHVERFFLSAHISGPQNVEVAKVLKPGKIYLGHGEKESRIALARVLSREGLNAEPLQEKGQIILF